MTEAFLHYVWQHQMLNGGLTTTDGQPVVVLKPGERNLNAGPDFFNARLKIGKVEWVGNVEIHVHSSDWKAHHHERDAAYNNVVLHVVYEDNGAVQLENGKSPLTLELKPYLHPSLVKNYESLMAPVEGNGIPCANRIGEVPGFLLHSFQERLLAERIEAKAETVRRLLEESHGNWEQTCYWLLARYFGGKVNALPFELTAKATDLRLLARWRNDRTRVEAILMGQAGLLDNYLEDDYPRALQADYTPLRTAAHLQPIDAYLWKFFRLRPSSFPTIRISQFADFISKSPHLFSQLLAITDAKEMEQLLNSEAAPYWDNHYQFDQPTEQSATKRLGKMQADLIIINAWVPLLFVYGSEHGSQKHKDQAVNLLCQLAPENNAVIRLWKAVGLEAANAGDSQALLQLKERYCAQRRCLECRIGYHILKKETTTSDQ